MDRHDERQTSNFRSKFSQLLILSNVTVETLVKRVKNKTRISQCCLEQRFPVQQSRILPVLNNKTTIEMYIRKSISKCTSKEQQQVTTIHLLQSLQNLE